MTTEDTEFTEESSAITVELCAAGGLCVLFVLCVHSVFHILVLANVAALGP